MALGIRKRNVAKYGVQQHFYDISNKYASAFVAPNERSTRLQRKQAAGKPVKLDTMATEIMLSGPSVHDHRMEDHGRIYLENGRDRAKKNIGVGSPKSAGKSKEILECKIQDKPRTRGVSKRTHWRSRKVFGRRWSAVVVLDQNANVEEPAQQSSVAADSVYNALKLLGNTLADPLRMFFGLGADEMRAAGDIFSGHVERMGKQQAASSNVLKSTQLSTAPMHHGHKLRPLTILSVHPQLPQALQREIQQGIPLRATGCLDVRPKLPKDLKDEIHRLPPLPLCKGVIMRKTGKFNIPRAPRSSPTAALRTQSEGGSELQHHKRVSAELRHWEDHNMSLESRLAPAAFFLPKLPRALQTQIRCFAKALLTPTGNLLVRPRLPRELQNDIRSSVRGLDAIKGVGSPTLKLRVSIPGPLVLRHTGIVSPRPKLRDALMYDIRRHLVSSLRPAGNLAFAPKLPRDLQRDIHVGVQLRPRSRVLAAHPKLPGELQREIIEGVPWRTSGNLAVRPFLPLRLKWDIEHGVSLRHVGPRSEPSPPTSPLAEHALRGAHLRLRLGHDVELETKLYRFTSGTSPGVLTLHLRGNCGFCPEEGCDLSARPCVTRPGNQELETVLLVGR